MSAHSSPASFVGPSLLLDYPTLRQLALTHGPAEGLRVFEANQSPDTNSDDRSAFVQATVKSMSTHVRSVLASDVVETWPDSYETRTGMDRDAPAYRH